MDIHLFQRKTIFSRNYRSQGLFVFKTKEKGDWYQNRKWLFDLVLLGYEEYFETLPQKGWIKSWWMQLPCRSVDYHGVFPCPLLQLGDSILQWTAERLVSSLGARVSESVLIYCCVHKCHRRKLLSRAAYSNVQLSRIPCRTGLNSRCAEASLTLEFFLSVKHRKKNLLLRLCQILFPGIF